MASVQTDDVVSRSYRGPDRRRGGFLGKLERCLVKLVRSRWIAMFAVAFAVSWSFHLVEEREQHRLEHQQRIIICTIDGVARVQAITPSNARVDVRVILQACEQRNGKE